MANQVLAEASAQVEDDRSGLSVETLKRAILDNLFCIAARTALDATDADWYTAVSYTVRDRILKRWLETREQQIRDNVRTVAYLSAEFLLGPHLGNHLLNFGLEDAFGQATRELGISLDQTIEYEKEPGLGNGGLGRLAACYLDSMATKGIPAIGYGIRYEYGIFRQEIKDGWQAEMTDHWLSHGNPWEIRRPDSAVHVSFGGHTESELDSEGRFRVRWVPRSVVKGVPFDTPISGFRSGVTNDLRLWRSVATESFFFARFNSGDYEGAVKEKTFAENVTKVLYPNDEEIQGKELRLQQQYFFTSCALQDMVRHHTGAGRTLKTFHEKWAVQLNDTHPSIGIAELLRLLLDEHAFDWDEAWHITSHTFAYTNHTLLPEALERWSLPLFASILPRHLEIIYEINRRFLDEVRRRYPDDVGKVARLSLIGEGNERQVRMANLACVGSHTINGVAELHTQLLKSGILRDFYELWPEKFVNVTNGVTPRRWLALSNPEQASIITRKIGDSWLSNLEELKALEVNAEDAAFRADWRVMQHAVKERLAQYILKETGVMTDPHSMFDAQVKRIHEYKRQHLNVLYILTLYWRIKNNPHLEVTPRTFLFGGKAAPGYQMAKLIIKLINSVAEVVNADPDTKDKLKVVFLPNYNVKFGQKMYPAADLSEQISTAGKEASGTGNMKFAMNGALTIGTLDGANIEIRDAVGHENFFLFGLTADQVQSTLAAGYDPWHLYQSNPELREVMDGLILGRFSRGDQSLFLPLLDSLLHRDSYLLFADYSSYVECQDKISGIYQDRDRWSRMSILNVARMGKFSSDRAIDEYCHKVWSIQPTALGSAKGV